MFQIIPAIDILDGQVVRLTKGDYTQVTVYSNDPVAYAQKLAIFGWLHIVDLNGAKAGLPVNTKIIKAIRQKVNCKLQVGGGIRTSAAAEELISAGVDRIVLGSIALKNKLLTQELVKKYGTKIVIGIDTKNGRVATEGWLQTSQTSDISLIKEMSAIGVKNIIYTDISRDGTLTGPNLDVYANLVKQTKIKIIASGGIANIEDIKNLKKIKKLSGVIVGKALYENRISLEELKTLA